MWKESRSEAHSQRSRRRKNEYRENEYRKDFRIGLLLFSVLVISRFMMDSVYGSKWLQYSSNTIGVAADLSRFSSTEELQGVKAHGLTHRTTIRVGTFVANPQTNLTGNRKSTKPETGEARTSAGFQNVVKKNDYSSLFRETRNLDSAVEPEHAVVVSSSTNHESKAEYGAGDVSTSGLRPGRASDELIVQQETLETRNEPAAKMSSLPSELFQSDNITRVSVFVRRLIKTHRISSMIDISCCDSKLWMPAVLRLLEYEVPGFRYHCLVTNDLQKGSMVQYYKDMTSVEFLVGTEYHVMTLPTVDLALMWNTVGLISVKQASQLIQGVSKARIKYILMSNYPQITKNSAELMNRGQVNARRPPYKLGSPLRIIQNVSVDPLIAKQMLFYDVNNINKK